VTAVFLGYYLKAINISIAATAVIPTGWFIPVIIDDANGDSYVNTDNAVDITGSGGNPSGTGSVLSQKLLLLEG